MYFKSVFIVLCCVLSLGTAEDKILDENETSFDNFLDGKKLHYNQISFPLLVS